MISVLVHHLFFLGPILLGSNHCILATTRHKQATRPAMLEMLCPSCIAITICPSSLRYLSLLIFPASLSISTILFVYPITAHFGKYWLYCSQHWDPRRQTMHDRWVTIIYFTGITEHFSAFPHGHILTDFFKIHHLVAYGGKWLCKRHNPLNDKFMWISVKLITEQWLMPFIPFYVHLYGPSKMVHF